MFLRDILRKAREKSLQVFDDIVQNIPQAPFSGPTDFAKKVLLPQQNPIRQVIQKAPQIIQNLPQAPARNPIEFIQKISQPVQTGVSGAIETVKHPISFLSPQSFFGIIPGVTLPKGRVYTPKSLPERLVFGNEPIRPIGERIQEYEKKIIEQQNRLGNTSIQNRAFGILPAAGGPLFMGGLASLDVLPGGKGAKTAAIKGAEELFDVAKYVKQNVAKRELERSGGQLPSFFGKIKNLFTKASTGVVEDQTPIINVLKKYGTETEKLTPYKQWMQQTGEVYKSDSMANQFIDENIGGINKFFKQLKKSGLDKDTLDEYLIARHAMEYERAGKATGRNLIADSKLLEQLSPQYEPYAKIIDNYVDALRTKRNEFGLTSVELEDALKQKYQNYVPFKRVFDETGSSSVRGSSRAVAGSSKNVIQKAVGSYRPIDSPLESLLKETYSVFDVGNKKKAAELFKSFADLPAIASKNISANPFGITTLKEADNAVLRKNLAQQHIQLNKTKEVVYKWLKSGNKEARQLRSQINELQKEGLFRALRKEEKEAPNIIAKITQRQGARGISVSEKGAIPTKTQLRQIVDSFVNEPDVVIQRIQARTDLKVEEKTKLLSILERYKTKIDDIKSQQAGLREQIRAHADIKKTPDEFTLTIPGAKGKTVITADPEYMKALKGLNEQQLNSLLKVSSYIVRTFKLGTTGWLAPANVIKQLVKDPLSALIFGKSNLKAFTPQSYISALIDTFKLNPAYKEAINKGAISSSFDVTPRDIKKSIKNLTSRISFNRSLTGLESFFSKFQEAEYLSQYKVLKDVYLKKGMSEDEAMRLAAQNTKEFLTDFSRKGTYSNQLGALLPYLRSSIQGARTTVRAFKERPVETGLKLVAAGYTPIVALTLWNLSDKERAEQYKDILESERDNNFIVLLPIKNKDGKFVEVTVPIQGGLNSILRPARKIIENMYDVGDPISFKYAADSLLGGVSPFTTDVQNDVRAITPQPLQPIIDVATNTKFGGNDIYANRDIPTQQQAYPNTSEFARFVGEKVGMAPVDVDYLFTQYFNFPYKVAANASDRALIGLGITDKQEAGGKSLFSEFKDIFTNPYHGQINKDQKKKIGEYKQKSAGIANEEYRNAQAIYNELKTLSPEDAKNRLKALAADDEDLVKRIIDMKKSETLGVTSGEKAMLQLGITDGTRAQYIWNEELKGKSSDEQKEILKDLVSKEIITEKVLQQLIYLKSKE